MNILDTQRVLGGQSRSRCHGIYSMSGQDFLIGFEAAAIMSVWLCSSECTSLGAHHAYAPPELSEPAITSTRGVGITRDVSVIGQA
jgi:hypothetical protein